jgi:thioredoxin reductase (NADPH)
VTLPVAKGSRYDETFPTMSAPETERLRRYGTLHKYADGERLVETGKTIPGAFVVLRGAVAIAERDGLGHTTPLAELGSRAIPRRSRSAFPWHFAGRRHGRG